MLFFCCVNTLQLTYFPCQRYINTIRISSQSIVRYNTYLLFILPYTMLRT